MFKGKGLKNFIITLICQLSVLAFGFLLPKITVSNLGSDANGFLSTINDIFTYLALIEGGLGLALLNSLYKPLQNQDEETTSALLTASSRRFKITALVYLVASIIVGLIYPLFLDTTLTYSVMSTSIIAYGIGGASTMFLASSIIQYLIAAGKSYIREVVHLFIYFATSMLKIVCIVLFQNIVMVCLTNSILCLIEALIYKYYFKIKCKNFSLNSKTPLYEPLNEQKYFWVHQISSAIFGSTDLFIISIFCSLKWASIYAVYALIFTAISRIVASVFNSLKYLLGNAYVKDIEHYKKTHDIFDCIYMAVMFGLLLIAYLLSNSFVAIYMDGADINYVDKYLPLLFVISNLLSSCRSVCNNTHNIAHRVKQNIIPTILEAILNIGFSLLFVNMFGIYGVILGTIVALLFRTNQTIIYTNKYILTRSSFATYKYILIYTILFVALNFLCKYVICATIDCYWQFIVWGVIYSALVFLSYGLLCIVINKDIRIMLNAEIRKKCKS